MYTQILGLSSMYACMFMRVISSFIVTNAERAGYFLGDGKFHGYIRAYVYVRVCVFMRKCIV